MSTSAENNKVIKHLLTYKKNYLIKWKNTEWKKQKQQKLDLSKGFF